MKARSHSMPEACPETSLSVQIVQVEVSLTHPLLLLKQALPWEAITEALKQRVIHGSCMPSAVRAWTIPDRPQNAPTS